MCPHQVRWRKDRPGRAADAEARGAASGGRPPFRRRDAARRARPQRGPPAIDGQRNQRKVREVNRKSTRYLLQLQDQRSADAQALRRAAQQKDGDLQQKQNK